MESPDPTPEEIAAECARIRATWEPQEEAKRRRWSIAPPVSPAESILHFPAERLE